jgi:hypothetical protein
MTENTRRCRAKRSNGEPCRGAAIRGADVCRMHGGAAPQVRRAAAARAAHEEAARAVAAHGAAPLTDPFLALAKLGGEVVAMRESLLQQIEKLRALPSEQDVLPLLAAYERAADRSARVLHDMARLGLDGHYQQRIEHRLAERQGALMARVLQRFLDDPLSGVDHLRVDLLRQLAAHYLRSAELDEVPPLDPVLRVQLMKSLRPFGEPAVNAQADPRSVPPVRPALVASPEPAAAGDGDPVGGSGSRPSDDVAPRSAPDVAAVVESPALRAARASGDPRQVASVELQERLRHSGAGGRGSA